VFNPRSSPPELICHALPRLRRRPTLEKLRRISSAHLDLGDPIPGSMLRQAIQQQSVALTIMPCRLSSAFSEAAIVHSRACITSYPSLSASLQPATPAAVEPWTARLA
jgi:hypothetical protein